MLNKIHVPADPTHSSDTPPAAIDALFDQLQTQEVNHLVLYFHGGLNSREVAEQTADRLSGELAADGRHLIGFIWETGPTETLTSMIGRRFKVPLIEKAIAPVQRWIEKWQLNQQGPGVLSAGIEPQELAHKLSDEEAAALKKELLDALDTELAGDSEFQQALNESLASYTADLNAEIADEAQELAPQPGTLGLGQGFLEIVNALDIKGKIARAGMQVIERRLADRDHGLKETIVEELVREFSANKIRDLWDDMKERALEMWRADPVGDLTSHPAAYFLHRLASWQAQEPQRTVDLIGHSAGSIVICHLLAAAAWKYEDTLIFRDVIFLAPAVTMDLFYEEIVTKPERYRRLRLFTMSDEKERHDRLKLGQTTVFTRSLLYAIAGILENEPDLPLAGMTRYLSGEPPFDSYKLLRIGKYLRAPGEKRLIESVTPEGDPDVQCSAITHGAFDNNRHTLRSIRIMLGQ